MRFTPIDKTCQHCGTVFRVTQKVNAGRKYCSSACYHAYEAEHGGHGVVPRIEFSCAKCETPFFFEPGQLRAYRNAHGQDPKYCSRRCAWDEKRKLVGQPCVVCGKPVPVEWRPSPDGKRTPRTVGRRNKICSPECRSKFKTMELERLRPLETREVSRTTAAHGYIRLIFPRTETSDGFEILEHRWVMQQMLGRPLRSDETIHHMNGQKTDNRPSNLQLRSGNHGPGGDVNAMVKWAYEIIALYPQFDREGNFTPAMAPPDHQ